MSLAPATCASHHCYRHPDRETGRSCTRCGKPACGDCLVQVSVGSHCLDCIKAARPDVKTRAKFWNARQPTLVTYSLIAINAVVYLWTVNATEPSTSVGSLTVNASSPSTSPTCKMASTTAWSRRASCTSASSTSA